MFFRRSLRAGDLVEVRSREEVLATLDENGMLERMPFMPEMLRHCGHRFTVAKVAHKTCDTIHYAGARRLGRSVHLANVRCDGSAHAGCQAGCLIFWKEAWLKRVRPDGVAESAHTTTVARPPTWTVERLEAAARGGAAGPRDAARYVCQATELLRATEPLPWWDARQYVRDFMSRNFSLGYVLRALFLAGLRALMRVGVGYRLLLRMHNRIAVAAGSRGVCDLTGPIPKGAPTPASDLKLRAGDWVRVRSGDEIVSTLNINGRNKGLSFDSEMLRYCGEKFRVQSVIETIIDEGSGRVLAMKNPCIRLEGVYCRSEYIAERLMCPRAMVHYWRPIWLDRLPQTQADDATPGAGKPGG